MQDSIEDEDDVQRGTTTSFINVTMKSRPVTPRTNGINGHHNTSSSRVFVSSPEPRSESPYFQVRPPATTRAHLACRGLTKSRAKRSPNWQRPPI